jgi:hypothetical protein
MNTSHDRGDSDLLRPLRDIDTMDGPPPRYDVALAMRHGDAIRRRRMSIGAFAVVVVAAAAIGIPLGLPSPQQAGPEPSESVSVPPASASVPPPSSPVPDITSATELPVANCTVTTLTAPAAAGALSTWGSASVDPTGHYLVAALVKPFTLPAPDYLPGKPLLVDLRTGRMTLIPVGEGGVAGVNASGAVIGTSGPKATPWVYRNGKVTPLPKFHGATPEPYGINARGDIIGQVGSGNNETSVIWPATQPGTVRALLPVGLLAYTITDSGMIGGSIGGPNEYRPYVGDGEGNGRTLPTGANDPRGQVHQIRGDFAVGWGLSNITEGLIPMVWNLATDARTPYAKVSLVAIGTDGTVAGDTTPDADPAGARIGLIGHGGVLEMLPTGVAGNPPVYIYDITADGTTIVGVRHSSPAGGSPVSQVGVVWHC